MKPLSLSPAEVLLRIDAQRKRRAETETPFTAPRNQMEHALAACWADVLGLAEIGVDANFFRLGGNSLQMTQIASRMRQRHGVEISFERFFDHPSVAALAKSLSSDSVTLAAATPTDEMAAAITFLQPHSIPAPKRSTGDDAAMIDSIVIPTGDRPAALERCLSGIAKNLRRFGRNPSVIVFDSSRNEGNRRANQEAARRIQATLDANLMLIGPEARETAVALLASCVDRETAEFAVEGMEKLGLSSSGAARNLLLLATAGHRIVSIDDDTECRFATPPGFSGEVGTAVRGKPSGEEPDGIWVRADRTALLSEFPAEEFDFVGVPGQMLGAQVRMTLYGAVGDCGWGSPSRYLFIDDASFERLCETDASYLTGTASREMLRVAPECVVTDVSNDLMTTAYGADNRTPLPPFVPVGRGSDVVVGHTLRRLDSGSLFGYIPRAILHSPVEPRRFWPGEVLRSAGSTDLRQVFCGLLDCVGMNPQAMGDDAFRWLGDRLEEIASRSLADFRKQLASNAAKVAATDIRFLEERLRRFGRSSTPWTGDIEEYKARVDRGRMDSRSGIPAELLYANDEEQALVRTREIVLRYALLLRAWPDIVLVARDAHDRLFQLR